MVLKAPSTLLFISLLSHQTGLRLICDRDSTRSSSLPGLSTQSLCPLGKAAHLQLFYTLKAADGSRMMEVVWLFCYQQDEAECWRKSWSLDESVIVPTVSPLTWIPFIMLFCCRLRYLKDSLVTRPFPTDKPQSQTCTRELAFMTFFFNSAQLNFRIL